MGLEIMWDLVQIFKYAGVSAVISLNNRITRVCYIKSCGPIVCIDDYLNGVADVVEMRA